MRLLPRSRRWLIPIAIVGVGVILAAWFHVWPFTGVSVVVKNLGPEPVKNVVVLTSGGSYDLGDIGVGQSRGTNVQARGESHVEIEFSDQANKRLKHVVGGYFETNNYHGKITVEFEHGAIKRVDNQIELWIW